MSTTVESSNQLVSTNATSNQNANNFSVDFNSETIELLRQMDTRLKAPLQQFTTHDLKYFALDIINADETQQDNSSEVKSTAESTTEGKTVSEITFIANLPYELQEFLLSQGFKLDDSINARVNGLTPIMLSVLREKFIFAEYLMNFPSLDLKYVITERLFEDIMCNRNLQGYTILTILNMHISKALASVRSNMLVNKNGTIDVANHIQLNQMYRLVQRITKICPDLMYYQYLNEDTELNYRISHHDLRSIMIYIKNGVNLNFPNQHGITPLLKLLRSYDPDGESDEVINSKTRMCEYLIRFGSDLDQVRGQNESALNCSIYLAESARIAALLLSAGHMYDCQNSSKQTSLDLTQLNPDQDPVRYRIASDRFLRNAGITPPSDQVRKTIGLMLQAIDQLFKAVSTGDVKKVKEFVDSSFPLRVRNASGQTSLHVACFLDHHEVVELLIGKGEQLLTLDKNGHTPLDLIAKKLKQFPDIKSKSFLIIMNYIQSIVNKLVFYWKQDMISSGITPILKDLPDDIVSPILLSGILGDDLISFIKQVQLFASTKEGRDYINIAFDRAMHSEAIDKAAKRGQSQYIPTSTSTSKSTPTVTSTLTTTSVTKPSDSDTKDEKERKDSKETRDRKDAKERKDTKEKKERKEANDSKEVSENLTKALNHLFKNPNVMPCFTPGFMGFVKREFAFNFQKDEPTQTLSQVLTQVHKEQPSQALTPIRNEAPSQALKSVQKEEPLQVLEINDPVKPTGNSAFMDDEESCVVQPNYF